MNTNEKALARLIFKNKTICADGQAFEDLFIAVMQKANPDFKPVKPQGQFGDRKNDGYDRKKGIYYQVFAPENLQKSAGRAVKKLVEDFQGLKDFWENICPVRQYHFVMNDKYKGTLPEVEQGLALIKKQYDLEDCASFLAKNLEDILLNLSDDEIVSIIGFIPDPEKIELIDYSMLTQVIGHIMLNERPVSPSQNLTAPDFDEKIRFNRLGKQVSTLLSYASFQAGSLEEYFELNSEFTRQELRNILNEIYVKASAKDFRCSDTDKDVNNLIFFDILNSIIPDNSKRSQDAALVLMSYFFESCDIFEDPNYRQEEVK